ncbi:Retrovirus-related Pol polyprotein from transposon TNT 1-94 [Symbiodinium microadriaticum]|uniref:Retrovirus-related Pol polyprotein from transposon TNT 1-94 n=1 Tax=Symbiodinium microadriaticum TaxID=2951 RepID=A0A1Q9CKU9_SYMMI|nr:Retrovirus-related Pol polyprotein from transposon TNT 1-94 [Symbiodinium microadriaticum]
MSGSALLQQGMNSVSGRFDCPFVSNGSPSWAIVAFISYVYAFSAEMVQAEVARQLDAAMSDVMTRGQVASSDSVLVTLAKGIEALLQQQQQGVRGERPETVKPGITELPHLPEYQPSTGSIDLLHWLTHIAPIMEDLSDTSFAWWQETTKDALAWYGQYSTATPLARLQLKPVPSSVLKPEWARVERRATAMMLSAVPKAIREEIIAHGQVSTLDLLCKLYSVYQPGNLQEKTLVLKMLEQPEECTTALQAVEGLRRWSLWRRRAASLGMAEPDASVLVRGLDKITGPIIKGSGELAFRVSLIRSTLQVDVSPSATTVTTFLQHLQAEMEQQARLGAARVHGDGQATLRALNNNSNDNLNSNPQSTTPTTPTTTRPKQGSLCKFFASDTGCRRGNGCRYPHTWALLEKGARQKKCLCCGSVQHKVKECKAPGGGLAKAAGTRATSGAGETGSTSPTASTPDTSQRKVNFEDDGVIQAKVLRALQEIHEMPMFKAVLERVKKWVSGGYKPLGHGARQALLDSGATHVLRAPWNEEEWNGARQVNVQLAGDHVAPMKQNEAGSLLSGDQLAQVIVPLGKVISTLGYKLSWTSEVCELIGPGGEVLPLTVKNGCPEVSERTAYKLIQELEDQQLPRLDDVTQASVQAIHGLKTSWWSYLKEYVRGGNVIEGYSAIDKANFFDYKDVLKEHVVTRLPKLGIWELLKTLNINRRARKRLLRASGWIIRWDAPSVDKSKDSFKQLAFVGSQIYVNMNTLLSENEFADVWRVVQWAAFVGKVDVVVAKDCAPRPLDQLVAGPHRSKIHFLHALASAAREVCGGGAVRLFIEEPPRVRGEVGDASWPPWSQCQDAREYLLEMGLLGVAVDNFGLESHVRLAKLSSDASWRLHVARNHQPFRRDCSVCVRNSAAGHQHRTTMHPMAYSLSVDVVGPLKGYGRSPDGKFFKYFVIGAMRIPKVDGAEGHPDVRGHPLPPPHEEEEESISDEEEDLPPIGADEAGVGLDEVEKEKKQWEDLVAMFKQPIATTTLYFAVPVNNKKAATMLPAVQKIVTDVKALGYPVTRIHSDRGGEFRGNLVRKWALASGMWPTTTSGSDSAANGVAESGVRYLKRRARILLDSAGIDKGNWPTAVQYAAAQQRCDQLGVLPPMPVAYGAKVYVKTKRYKTGAVEDFGPHWTRGRYVGPSTDVRGGHVVLKEAGTFIQTTHLRITSDPPPLDEVTPTVIVEPEETEELPSDGPPLPPPLDPPPHRRYRVKAPVASKVDGFYPFRDVLYEVPSETNDYEDDVSQVKYLRASEISYVEAIAQQLCNENKYHEKDCARLLSLFAGTCGNLKVPRAPEGTGMILGAFVHGGNLGVTRYGRDLPWTTRYFNSYLLQKLAKTRPSTQCSWTALAIQSAEQIPRHKDSHNERGTYNYVMELKTSSPEGLWVQDGDHGKQVEGGMKAREHQYDYDGKSADGHLVDIAKNPAVFDPLIPHAYVKEKKVKWFLSAYTPQGAYKLNSVDQEYLESLNFPLAKPRNEEQPTSGAPETRPAMKRASLPSESLWSGACGEGDDVEVYPAGDCEATMWDWAIYVEQSDEHEEEKGPGRPLSLKRVCSSDEPGTAFATLVQTSEFLDGVEDTRTWGQDLNQCVDHWTSLGLHECPCLAKLEPEYTENIEGIIEQAVTNKLPLRHTYNVSPHEAKAVVQKWESAIKKELGVVERGFKRISMEEVSKLKGRFQVQELPSKLVYTIKPPAGGSEDQEEATYCKRKARIVCCGNYAAEDQGELFAGGAAAESLRCALTYTAKRKWRAGITDITGAFMLTPLPTGAGEVIYIIRPPTALVQLGLAEPSERWQLTHGMYGLRQSPKLWSAYRDAELRKMIVRGEETTWVLKQGTAEPNMWLIYEAEASGEEEPAGLILVYVDDILLCGPLQLVRALSSSIRSRWKASELELLDVDHEIRFLGCEIAVTEEYDAVFIHQRPYIDEILRHHEVRDVDQSPIQAPKELVTFEAFDNEDAGSPDDVKQAQRACGELLWIAQRSRPDISFVVCAMGSLLTRAAPRCLQLAARLRSYLQRTKNLALALRPTCEDLTVFTDSSFAPEGAKSHSGLVAVWLGAPVCWRSARQPFVCLSTAECELLAATEGLVMGKSIESVINQMCKTGHIYLRVDNQAAVTLTKPYSSTSWRTRHLRVRASFIHEQVDAGQVTVAFIQGKLQWADLLTKAFPRQRLEELVGIWGFVDLVTQTSKLALVRVMIMAMMVQTARAQVELPEPLAFNASIELYVMILVLGIAVVGVWEFLWLCVDHKWLGATDTSISYVRQENVFVIVVYPPSQDLWRYRYPHFPTFANIIKGVYERCSYTG